MVTPLAVLRTVVGMNRVGVAATAGVIGRSYSVSRHRAKKILEGLIDEGAVVSGMTYHRPGIQKRVYAPTKLGIMLTETWEDFMREYPDWMVI